MKVGTPLAKTISEPLATMESASALDGAIQRKIHGLGVARAGKRIFFVIWNEDTDNIIKNIKSLENSSVLIGKVSGTVKHEIKKQESRFLGMLGNMLIC